MTVTLVYGAKDVEHNEAIGPEYFVHYFFRNTFTVVPYGNGE